SSSTSVSYCLTTNPGTYTSGIGGVTIPVSYDYYYTNGNSSYSYDDQGNSSLSTYYPSGQDETDYTGYGTSNQTSETYTYDLDGNTLTDDAGGDTITSTYNDADWNLTSTDSDLNKTTYAYDADGNVTTETDPGTSMAVTGGTWTGNVATLDFASNTAPGVGGTISVSNVTPGGYNGT